MTAQERESDSGEQFTSSGRKRKVTNYNLDYLSQVNYQQALQEVEHLQMKKSSKQRTSSVLSGSGENDDSVRSRKRKPESSTAMTFEAICDSSRLRLAPMKGSRALVDKLKDYAKFAKASGGFLLFVQSCNDSMLHEICRKVDSQGVNINEVLERIDCVAQALRYAWNTISEEGRLRWEMVAREEAKLKCAIDRDAMLERLKEQTSKVDEVKEMENAVLAISGSDAIDGNDGETVSSPEQNTQISQADGEFVEVDGKVEGDLSLPIEVIREMRSMPLSEVRFLSAEAKERKENVALLKCSNIMCPMCKEIGHTRFLQAHLLQSHYSLQLYGCHSCFEAFPSKDALQKHPCQEFAQFILNNLASGSQCDMNYAMHTLVCAECNLQVPLPKDEATVVKRLENLAKLHSCDRIISCVVYFARIPAGVEYVTVRRIAMTGAIPLKCPHCSHQFTTASDIEKHQLSEHLSVVEKNKCPLCPRSYVTQLFYREHLLTHLGDGTSMIPVIESATMMPPFSMSDATPRMGPMLEKIVGPGFACAPQLNFPEEVSDAEDVSFLKDENERKCAEGSKPEKAKEKKKQPRRSNEERCYSCRQTKQILPKQVRSDLCRCKTSLAAVGKHQEMCIRRPSDTQILLHSLCEKFAREGRLSVGFHGIVLDPTKGAILSECVYICVRCNALHLGNENTMRHLRICRQKDVAVPDPEKQYDLSDTNIVIRLTHPTAAMNTRVSCPQCSLTFCSIPGLRRHLAQSHGVFASFTPSEASKAVGLMEFVGQFKKRCTLTEMLNEEMDLTKSGNFKTRPFAHFVRPALPPKMPLSNHIEAAKTADGQSKQSNVVRPGPSTLIRASDQPSLMAHDSAPLLKSLTCPLCNQKYDSAHYLSSHFDTYHLNLCEGCGIAFGELEPLRAHEIGCQKWTREHDDGEFLPQCQMCSFVLSTPRRYFQHLIQFHESHFAVDRRTRQLGPMFIWKKVPLEEARRRKGTVEPSRKKNQPVEVAPTTVPRLQPQQCVPSSSAKEENNDEGLDEERHHCYICEKQFKSSKERRKHMDDHPERWTSCPVCRSTFQNYAVKSLSALLQHMLQRHIQCSSTPQGTKVVCGVCYTCFNCDSKEQATVRLYAEQMFRHILFDCNAGRMCFICNDGVSFAGDELKTHRLKFHRHCYERFGCSKCPKVFATRSEFKKHICHAKVMCSCGDRTEFTDIEFDLHFRMHVNHLGDFCLLCNKYLSTKQQQYSHRTSHRIISKSSRRMIDFREERKESAIHAERASSLQETADQAIPSRVSANDATAAMKTSNPSFRFRTVKPEEDPDDDIIIIDPPAVDRNTSAAKDVVAESASAAASITDAAGKNDEDIIGIPMPTNLRANIRTESDTILVETAPPTCTDHLGSVPTFSIDAETNEEAVAAIIERMLCTVAGPSDDDVSEDGNQISIDNSADTYAEAEQLSVAMEESRPAKETALDGHERAVEDGDDDDVLIIEDNSAEANYQVPQASVEANNGRPHNELVDTETTATEAVENSDPQPQQSPPAAGVIDQPQVPDDSDEVQVISDSESNKKYQDETLGEALKTVGVKEGVEDDDELQIITTFKGPGMEFVKKRDPRVECSRCHTKFMTKGALEVHMSTHRYDAGNTIEAVYGLPVGLTVYICRLCCLGYESKAVYDKHMHTHGTLYSCDQCSVVTFNEEQHNLHVAQHTGNSEQMQNRLVYVCSTCISTYSSDERLYHHMTSRHKQVILYFCKKCGLANTNGRVVYLHIAQNECGGQQARPGLLAANMGFAAACYFHYQPINPGQHEIVLQRQGFSVVVPSECIHRSFLMAQSDHVSVTCPTCHGLMNYLRLQSEYPDFAAKFPRQLNIAPDDNSSVMQSMIQFWKEPLARVNRRNGNRSRQPQAAPVWNPPLGGGVLNNPNRTQPIPRTPAPHPAASNASVVVAQQSVAIRPSQVVQMNPAPPLATAIRLGDSSANVPMNVQVRMRPSTCGLADNLSSVQPSASFQAQNAVVRRSAPQIQPAVTPSQQPQCALRTNVQFIRHSNPVIGVASPMARPSVQRVATVASGGITQHIPREVASPSSTSAVNGYASGSAANPAFSSVITTPGTTDYIVRLPNGQLMCSRPECQNIRIEKVASGYVHNLRHNISNTHFCLECGYAFSCERDAVVHQIVLHHQKALPQISLECPFCRDDNVPPFTSLDAFKEHLRQKIPEHSGLRYYRRYRNCALLFHTEEAMRLHESEHRASTEECCLLCGTSKYFWFSPKTRDMPPMEHTLIHAFALWGMCRECGLCFPNELKKEQFVRHYQQAHMNAEGSKCNTCKICVHPQRIYEHATRMHFVIGMKTKRPFRIEASTTLLLNYLGFPIAPNSKV